MSETTTISARRAALAAALADILIDLHEAPRGADTARALALAARADRLTALIRRLDRRHAPRRLPDRAIMAWTCPNCAQDARTVLLHQAAYFGRDGLYVTVENAFECNACRRRWWQTLRFQPGEVLENTVR